MLHFYSSVSPKGEADIHCLAEGNLCSACRRKRAMGLQRADLSVTSSGSPVHTNMHAPSYDWRQTPTASEAEASRLWWMDRSVSLPDLNTLSYLPPHKRGKVNFITAIFLTGAEFTAEDAAARPRRWRQIKLLLFFSASLLIYRSFSVSVGGDRLHTHTGVLARKLLLWVGAAELLVLLESWNWRGCVEMSVEEHSCRGLLCTSNSSTSSHSPPPPSVFLSHSHIQLLPLDHFVLNSIQKTPLHSVHSLVLLPVSSRWGEARISRRLKWEYVE